MATLAFAGLGAAAAFFVGGPGAIQTGFNLGGLVGGLLFGNSQQHGPMDDLQVTGSSYGSTIPFVYGQTRVGSNVIWSTDLQVHNHYGKGGLTGTPTHYTYTCSFAVSVCRGPIYGISKIYAQDLLIYDSTNTPASVYAVEVYTGTEDQTPNSLMSSILGVAHTPAYRGQVYVVFENMDLTPWGNRLPQLSFELAQDPQVPTRVCDILADVAEQCGMIDGVDFNFGAMYDDVAGYVANQRTQGYAIVEPLIEVFSGDIAEIDGMLVAIRRGEPAVATIQASDMGAQDWQIGQEATALVETVRKSDLSLPFKFELGYMSLERQCQSNLQTAIRHSRPQIQDATTLNTNITMHDADAMASAGRKLDELWNERNTNNISVGFKWAIICPASPVLAVINGNTLRCRVIQQDLSQFGKIAMTLIADRSAGSNNKKLSGYMTQNAIAPYSPSSIQTQQTTLVPAVFDAYSGLEFRDEDGLHPGFYVVATGAAGWSGGTVYYSTDGISWTSGGAVSAQADFGVTTNTLPDGTVPLAIDTTDTLDVQLYTTGDLLSASSNDILNGINAALCGHEIISYKDVAPGSGNLAFDLTNLTRGQRGSMMTGHSTGERFWHLNSAVVRVPVDASLIGQTVHVKVVSSNDSLASVAAVDVVIAANNYPYATPADIANAQIYYVVNGDPGDPGFVFVEGFPVTTKG